MKHYYFIGTMIPLLTFDAQPEITFEEYQTLLSDNLSEKDFDKVVAVRKFFDILNLRSLWMGQPFDPRGTMAPLDMGEALMSGTGFPAYVFEFIDAHEKSADRLRHFPQLLSKFFKSGEINKDPFLRRYFNFERELRLVLTAFRAKKLGRDLNVEMQYEDPEEDLIAQILAQENAEIYEPPEKYQELKWVFNKYGDDPLQLQKALDEYRFNTIENMVDMSDTFSIERLLAYLMQLILVEEWFEFDAGKGKEIVDIIAKEK
jgi:hypothetical protein